jgi:hypothetical protein
MSLWTLLPIEHLLFDYIGADNIFTKNIYLQHLFVQQAIFLLEILLDPVGRQYLFVINFGSSIINNKLMLCCEERDGKLEMATKK